MGCPDILSIAILGSLCAPATRMSWDVQGCPWTLSIALFGTTKDALGCLGHYFHKFERNSVHLRTVSLLSARALLAGAYRAYLWSIRLVL